MSQEPFRQRFAWRATVRRSAEGHGARTELQRLAFRDGSGWDLPSSPSPLTSEQRRLVAAVLIGTGRDLSDEMAAPRSAIRRVLSDLEIPAEQRDEIESRLAALGEEIVTASASLGAVREALEHAEAQVGSLGFPHVNPVPAVTRPTRVLLLTRAEQRATRNGSRGTTPSPFLNLVLPFVE